MAKEYKRIGGKGARRRQFFTRNTLWLGADHLLQVEHTGYTEEYKRFYFRDIQSIIVQKDNRFLIWSLVLGGLLATCLTFVIQFDEQGAKIFFGCVAAPLFLALVINLIKGPSCYTRIKTAVQEEEVPAFRRVWKTQKAMAQVREMISAAQGTMSADEIRARLSGGSAFESARPAAMPEPTAPTASPSAG
jgi:hypothetical protein